MAGSPFKPSQSNLPSPSIELAQQLLEGNGGLGVVVELDAVFHRAVAQVGSDLVEVLGKLYKTLDQITRGPSGGPDSQRKRVRARGWTRR